MEYLRESNLAHHDVKLDNLVLDENWNLKLVDFGSAVPIFDDDDKAIFYNSDQDPEWQKGTCNYMPPEVIKSNLSFDQGYTAEKIDIFSVGIIGYAMRYKRYPFEMMNEKTNIKAYRAYISSDDAKSTPYKNFLYKLLVEQPEKRIGFDEVMKEPFMREATATNAEVKKYLDQYYLPILKSQRSLQN